MTAPSIPHVRTAASPSDWLGWIGQIARTVNLLLRGKRNANTLVTLAPNATQTVLIDERIGAFSAVLLSPQTEAAAQAVAAGVWVLPQSGQAIINHPSTPAADQVFAVVIDG
jgi:hypothetical protein